MEAPKPLTEFPEEDTPLPEVAKILSSNLVDAYVWRETLIGLQEWIREQQKAYK